MFAYYILEYDLLFETFKEHRMPLQCRVIHNQITKSRICSSWNSEEPNILFKGGDPAAGSPTATLLRLHPNHRTNRRRFPPQGLGARLRVNSTFVV